MGIYNVAGDVLQSAFNGQGNSCDVAYDVYGNLVYSSEPSWYDEISVEKLRDTATGTNYYVIHIPQIRTNGDKQYPFVYAPNGTGAGTQSTLSMNQEKGFYLAINAGIFYASAGGNPIGVIIEDGTFIQQGNTTAYAITIDEYGNIDYAEPNADGQSLIMSGVISAVVGYCPLIINGDGVGSEIYTVCRNYNEQAQRQIIGQFSNGDYCIITSEGRNFDNSAGWTLPQAISICEELGLQFAYNFDGGGSTETVIGSEQLNTIYEGTYGRIVPTYIVFNGTDEFFVPNA